MALVTSSFSTCKIALLVGQDRRRVGLDAEPDARLRGRVVRHVGRAAQQVDRLHRLAAQRQPPFSAPSKSRMSFTSRISRSQLPIASSTICRCFSGRLSSEPD